jgi:hypothetical protein
MKDKYSPIPYQMVVSFILIEDAVAILHHVSSVLLICSLQVHHFQ